MCREMLDGCVIELEQPRQKSGFRLPFRVDDESDTFDHLCPLKQAVAHVHRVADTRKAAMVARIAVG